MTPPLPGSPDGPTVSSSEEASVPNAFTCASSLSFEAESPVSFLSSAVSSVPDTAASFSEELPEVISASVPFSVPAAELDVSAAVSSALAVFVLRIRFSFVPSSASRL